jgi:16S rRNA (uracil1498-N3)-methyltransferase
MSEDLPSEVKLPLSTLSHGRIGAIVTVPLQGEEYRGRIIAVEKGIASVQLFERLSRPSESGLCVTLIQAMPKREKMELIIQKATELGVASIIPCTSERSITLAEREATQAKAHRWAAIAVRAVVQSRRRIIPEVRQCVDLATALEMASGSQLKIILYEREVHHSLRDFSGKAFQSLAIVAGPEGGFTEDEALLAQGHGYVPVRLGGRILRCETASIAAISIAQFLWGDL